MLAWLGFAVASAVWPLATSHIHLKATVVTIAKVTLVYSVMAFVPFACYFYDGDSWTAFRSTPEEHSRIMPFHAAGTMGWFFIGLVQLLLVWSRSWSLHNKLGTVGLGLVLPYCVLENATNAMFVFLPNKPMLLAQSVLGRDDVTAWEIVLHCGPFLMGLLAPVGFASHGWLAARSVWPALGGKRSARLHAHHMSMVVCWMLAAGLVRWWGRWAMVLSGCDLFPDRLLVIKVQATVFLVNGVAVQIVGHLLYLTLPANLRKDAGVLTLWWLQQAQSVLPFLFASYIGVDFWPSCHDVPDEKLAYDPTKLFFTVLFTLLMSVFVLPNYISTRAGKVSSTAAKRAKVDATANKMISE